ncbi:MAG TPA: hypothetical protein VGE07_25500 [Herpetosiphonaceae bacterium]
MAEAGDEERIERIFNEWRPVILTVAAAALDVAQARQDVEGFLPQLEGSGEWAALAGRIRLVLAGDQRPERLLAGLDATDTVVMSAILQALADPAQLLALVREERERAARDHDH